MGSFITTFTALPSAITTAQGNISTTISVSAIWYGKTNDVFSSTGLPAATGEPGFQTGHSSASAGKIAGLTIFGIILASLVVWGTWFFRRRRARNRLTPRPLQSLPPSPERRPLALLSQQELERVLALGPLMRETKIVPHSSLPATLQPESPLPTTPMEPSPILQLPSQTPRQPPSPTRPAVDPFVELPSALAPTPATRRQRKAVPRPPPPAPYATALQSSRTTIGQLTEEQMAVIEHLMARNVPASQVVELIDRMTSGAAVGGSDAAPEEAPPEYTRRA